MDDRIYREAWLELAKCFGERLQQDELDLMDGVLQGVTIDETNRVIQQEEQHDKGEG